MLHQYRITKYNPAFRGEDGVFHGNEWTSHSDIGRAFEGSPLTKNEYLKVEAMYLYAIEAFFREEKVHRLVLRGLENRSHTRLPQYVANGATLNVPQCMKFARFALRELAWGKLSVPHQAYVHFGYDYYMYLGVSMPCHSSINQVQERGLFVEPIHSPYLAGAL